MTSRILAVADALANYRGLISSIAAGVAASPYGSATFGEYVTKVFTAGCLSALTLPRISYHLSPSPTISDELPREYAATQLTRNLFIGTTMSAGALLIKNPSLVTGLSVMIGAVASILGERYQRTSKRELEALLLQEKSSALNHS